MVTGTGAVVIAGGAGAVGTMLTRALCDDGRAVTILDPAVPAATGTDGADRPDPAPRTVRGDITAPTGAAAAALRAAHTVVLAVPDTVAVRAVTALDPLLRDDALLVDTVSVKTAMADAVATGLRGRAALGINPMFAPTLPMRDRPVATVTYRAGPAVDDLMATLRRWGMLPVPVTADEHDRIAAATQALTHAAVLAFGVALTRLDPPAAAERAAPPPHRLLRALLARVASGTGEVYHDVQAANPYAAAARRALRDAVDAVDAVSGPADLDGFTALQRSACAALDPDAERYRRLCGRVFEDLPAAAPPTGPDASNGGGDDRP